MKNVGKKIWRNAAVFVLVVILNGCLASENSNGATEDRESFESNSPPSISGSPQTAIKSGDSYTFQPIASDPDGDALSFSITNKPVWAQFNNNTGRLFGQPLLGNVGYFDGISISVSDGALSATLGTFSITVTQVALASTSLSWTAPTQNSDGSTLVDLAGYRIYYGQKSGIYENSITISNPGVTSYLVENLVPGTYYFAATTLNSRGIESQYSAEVIKIAKLGFLGEISMSKISERMNLHTLAKKSSLRSS